MIVEIVEATQTVGICSSMHPVTAHGQSFPCDAVDARSVSASLVLRVVTFGVPESLPRRLRMRLLQTGEVGRPAQSVVAFRRRRTATGRVDVRGTRRVT